MKNIAAVTILLFACASITAHAEDIPHSPLIDRVAELSLKRLNEFSERRRLSTFFVNKQSARLGVQENFVNTTKGNVTFLVRNMVRVAPMPIVAGRVYDSSIESNPDFGPGWKHTR